MDILKKTSWDALRAFAVFAEEKNFTRAAGKLHLSQPALHTKIATLADSLGVSLYVRRGRTIEITDVGRKLQRFALELESTASEFESELQGQAVGDPVVLSAGEGSYLYLLGPGIRAYCKTKSRPLKLQTASAPMSVEAVLSARAHIGVASMDVTPAGLAVRPLAKIGQILVLPANHALARKRKVLLRDLNGARLIVPPAGAPHRTMLSRMLQSAGVEWDIAVEASGWELMVKFVQLGIGLAVVNEFCRLPKGLSARSMPELPSIQYSLFHLDKPLSKPAAELKHVLLEHANSWRIN